MRKYRKMFFIVAILFSLLLSSCNVDGTVDLGGSDADVTDSSTGNNSGSTDGDAVGKYKVIGDTNEIPLLPTENCYDYYVYGNFVYKLFYSSDDAYSFVQRLNENGVELESQAIGFDSPREDLTPIWIFRGRLRLTDAGEIYDNLDAENGSNTAEREAYEWTYSSSSCKLYYAVLYSDEAMHSSGLAISLYEKMNYEEQLKPVFFELFSNTYEMIDSAPDTPFLSHLTILPEEFNRELLGYVEEETGRRCRYSLTYDGKIFAEIKSCEPLSPEFLGELLDNIILIS